MPTSYCSVMATGERRIVEAVEALNRENPGLLDNVRLGPSKIPGAGMGLFVTRDYAPGDLVHSVPRELVLTGLGAKTNSPWAPDQLGDTTYPYLLAGILWGVSQAAAGVPGFAQFRLLPTAAELSHLPLYWSDEELAELQGTGGVAAYVAAVRKQTADLFAQHGPALNRHLPGTTLDNFTYAAAIVASRTWGAVGGDCALVPILDLLNHSSSAPCVTIEPGGPAVYRALTPIKSGDELFVNYGHKTAGEFLRGYGFIPDAGPNLSSVLVSINAQNPTSLADFILQKLPLTERIATVPRERPSVALLRITRILNVQYVHMNRIDDFLAGRMVDPDNETAAVRDASNLLRSLLATYPTTLDADTKALASPGIARRTATILGLRVLEKAALTGQIRLLTLPK